MKEKTEFIEKITMKIVEVPGVEPGSEITLP